MSHHPLMLFWGKMLWHLWIGRARHPGPCLTNLDIEVFNIGGILTHGEYSLDTDARFLALVEHRLVPARAHSEGARLKPAGLASVGSPLRSLVMLVMLEWVL